MSRTGLLINASFTEDAVAITIESYLTVLNFPFLNYSIEPFSRSKERWLGADGRLNSSRIKNFRPFYMQFKRPSAYPSESHSKIVKDRKSLSQNVSPHSLFFKLRDKSNNHFNYQHNILYKLRKRLISKSLGDAAYVCPLFLDRSNYRFHIHNLAFRQWLRGCFYHPWELMEQLVNTQNGQIKFSDIPVIAEHVSIPPHDLVDSAKHSYSFDENGKDICFHSPMRMEDKNTSLDLFLKENVRLFFDGDITITSENANEELKYLISGVDPYLESQVSYSQTDPFGAWLIFGDALRNRYEIQQFAVISRD